MKRERIEKGIERLTKFCAETQNARNPFDVFDETMREATIRTLMEFDFEELDYDTRWWLIEDESEFNEAAKEIARGIKLKADYMEKFSKHYDELKQEEESL